MACVYFLVSSREPDTVRYVGITKADTPEQRFARHLRGARLGSKLPVYDWMRKHQSLGFTIAAIAYMSAVTSEEACAAEQEYIVNNRATGLLLNLTAGGDGGGSPRTAETRAKISAAQRGKPKLKPVTPETRAKLSAALQGRVQTSEHRAAIKAGVDRRQFRAVQS